MTMSIQIEYNRFIAGFLILLIIITGTVAAETTTSPKTIRHTPWDIGVAITEYPTVVAGQMAIPPMPPLTINSDPDGAEIFINGKYVGTTPHWMYLSSGVHTITLKKEGYEDKTITINYDSNRGAEVNEVLEAPGFETVVALVSIGAAVLLMKKTR